MAIHLYCPKCYTSNGLDAKECSNCKIPFGKNRRFRVAVSVKGQRFTRVVDSLTVAREIESTAKSDMVRGEFDITHHKTKKEPTMAEIWARYLPWAQEHKKSWRDDRYYYTKHLEPRFGNKTLPSITTLDVERMKSELKKGLSARSEPYAPATIKHQVVLLRRLFNLAVKWGLYDGKNPVHGVHMPHVDNQKTEYLSAEELARLHQVLDNWPFDDSAAFVKFALYTGLRRGELFKLTWEAIDFERGLLRLVEPKGKRTVAIPVSDAALDVLHGLARTSPFVFPGKNGKQRTDFKGPWQRIRKAAELPEGFRFHGLRHHFASALVSNGVDLAIVRELLTHKDMTTTQRYAHLAPGAVKTAAQKSAALLGPKRGGTGRIVNLREKE
jgi:integrase